MGGGKPVHPGETLRTEFLDELNLSAYALAKAIGVPCNRVTAILHGQRSITTETALRFARYFGNSPEYWLTLQMHHDLAVSKRKIGQSIRTSVKPRGAVQRGEGVDSLI